MSSEIEVPETPNWLQELEAKREKRLKARLGHEAGAGAPCLKCGDKCPGLDLHFWRKCCKICKCAKEEHEVQDDDIYGWAQFQLLGSKPNKIKRKIVLPGKKDEVELDWAPKGHNETVDKYLKTLPPEKIPVKGSQAAQDRKQLLQKQIPVHDIDPTLCHELTEQELKQMNDYISHVKQTSVGVGQIVSLSSIIKGNLHMLNPNEAAIIASRYAKGIPLSEIVKLQAQNRAGLLKQQGLSQNLGKLSLNDPSNKHLPNFTPNSVTTTEQNLLPQVSNKFHDINYPGYANDTNQALPNAQFSSGLKPGQYKGLIPNNHPSQNQSAFDPTINEKYLQNPNFDPKNIPSQFISQNIPSTHAYPGQDGQHNSPFGENVLGSGSNQTNSAFVPYSKYSTGFRPEESLVDERHSKGSFASSLPGRGGQHFPGGLGPDHNTTISGNIPNYTDEANSQCPSYAKNLPKDPAGENNLNKNTFGDQFPQQHIPGNRSPYKNNSTGHRLGQNAGIDPSGSGSYYENVENMKNRSAGLPNYAPGKYNVHSEVHSPARIPKNVRDLAFSTYDPSNINPNEFEDNMADPKYNPHLPRHANIPYENYSGGLRPENVEPIGKSYPGGRSREISPIGQFDQQNTPYDHNLNRFQSDPYRVANENYPGGIATQNSGRIDNKYPSSEAFDKNTPSGQFEQQNTPFDAPPTGQYGGQGDNYPPDGIFGKNHPGSGNGYNQVAPGSNAYDRNAPADQYGPPNLAYENYPSAINPGGQVGHGNVPYGNHPGKKLSELHPGRITVNEDFLHPSQVTIGAIQDINYPEIKAATHGTNDFYEDYSPDSLREILNNIILPDCHYCKKPFEENEFAITIDRANVLFHAECFKCAGCNQILADNVYFYNKETDNVYCGRDYAKIRGFPRCKACDELIFTKEYCLAENSTFHLKHFCCIECDRPLAGQDYTLEDEMPYCLPCFEQSKASKCNSCCRVIKPDEVGCNLNGVHFHADDGCFACKMCKKPLMGQKLLLRNQKLYCSHDCFGADK